MARRRHKVKTIREAPSVPPKKFTRPREFFESGEQFNQFLIEKMKPGFICRVTNAGKLFIGPTKKRR